jgi:hypothetical protein
LFPFGRQIDHGCFVFIYVCVSYILLHLTLIYRKNGWLLHLNSTSADPFSAKNQWYVPNLHYVRIRGMRSIYCDADVVSVVARCKDWLCLPC